MSCFFTCHNKDPFLRPHASLCLRSHPSRVKGTFLFPKGQWMKKAFWNVQDRRAWSPWSSMCLSMSQSIGGWPWIRRRWWGLFLFPWQMGPSLSLFLSVTLFLGPGSAANTNHTERVVLSDLAVACCEAAVRAETHSLGGLALQMFMI